MTAHRYEREQRLPGLPEDVFAFFADARNLEAITPPLLQFRMLTPDPIVMGAGTLLRYRLRVHGVPVSSSGIATRGVQAVVFEAAEPVGVTAPADVTPKASAKVNAIAAPAAVALPNMKFLPVARPQRLWTRVR